MNREQLAEVLRAASQVVDDQPLVMGSQAILGTYEEDVLPPAATMSMEADIAFLNDQDRAKADLLTGAIGEDSAFHQLRGYYAEGIHVETATMPEGWRDRLITQPIPAGSNGPAVVASFLERHDLIVAKLAAFREKDLQFVTELARAELIDIQIARERLANTVLHPVARQRATGLLDTLSAGKRGRRANVAVGLDPHSPHDDAARLRRDQRRSHDPRPRHEPPPPGPIIS
jgi:hypothetical protein